MEVIADNNPLLAKLQGIRIDSTTKMGSAIDVARIITDLPSADARKRLMTAVEQLGLNLPHLRIDGKGRPTPVASPAVLKEIVKHLIASVRISAAKKRQLMDEWGIEGVCIKSHLEPDLVETLTNAFADYSPQTQHVVGPYRVDLYLKSSRVVLECDELDHSNYDAAAEMQRTLYITNALHCKWVRFNPNVTNFNIGDVICQTIKLL